MENELFEQTSVPKAYMKLAFPVVMSMMVSLVCVWRYLWTWWKFGNLPAVWTEEKYGCEESQCILCLGIDCIWHLCDDHTVIVPAADSSGIGSK